MLARCHTQCEIEALVVVHDVHRGRAGRGEPQLVLPQALHLDPEARAVADDETQVADLRSEEHTSELHSPCNLVCRLLLEKKKRRRTCHARVEDVLSTSTSVSLPHRS